MTFDERVRGLDPLGLTSRQARFVVTVALHSGYCLRRQYRAFAGLQYGKLVRHFLEDLVARDLATREICRADRGFLYHLRARSMYRALGQEDNRNRRRVSLAAIGRKLMLLDFVIAHPDAEWYATEDDKVDLFTRRFGVPLMDLPQKTYAAHDRRTRPTTRYFMHKLPISLNAAADRVQFVTLALEPTGHAFATFLRDHARLLSHVPGWTIVVVTSAGGARAVAPCRDHFNHYVRGPQSLLAKDRTEVVRYFATRRAVERHELAAVSVAEINWFREARKRLADPRIDSLYARWLVVGDHALSEAMSGPARSAIGRPQFVAHELPFAYEQFGDLAGVC